MGRTLVQLGSVALAVAVWAALAGSVGWVSQEFADRCWPLALKLGLACVAGGLILRTLHPVGRMLREGHCARCGRRVDRGQIYCRDHMKKALEEVRDQVRDGLVRDRPDRS